MLHDGRCCDQLQVPETGGGRHDGSTPPELRQHGWRQPKLSVGDVVVYPHHGIGTVIERSPQEIAGESRDYLTIEITGKQLTLKVPAELAPQVGLRPIASPTELHRALEALAGPPQPLADNWRARRRQALSKLALSDVVRLAEVVRDLSQMAAVKSLADNDRHLYAKARGLLESELKAALGISDAGAAGEIDRQLGMLTQARKAGSTIA